VPAEVIIVAHNPGHLLEDAVASAVEQAGAAQVWVMDAESTDGSIEAVRAQGVHVVPVPNAGFAAANNRGIQETSSDFLLLLNPDASLRPGALDALLATASRNPRAGIVGALVLNADGTVQAGSFGRFPSLAAILRLHAWRLAQRLRGERRPSPRAPSSTTPVDWVTGAAMLVRRAAVTEVGPMDQGFFLYYEDIEWCHRMWDRGWQVLLEPAAKVIHHAGSSEASPTLIARAYRDSFYRYCEIYGLWGLKTLSRVALFFRRLLGGTP
jgi:GT2 family glycosyltransferase